LHGHPVWPQRQHRFAPLPDLRLPAVHVGDEDLFGQGEATPELLTGPGHSVRHLRIQFFDEFNRHNLSPLIVKRYSLIVSRSTEYQLFLWLLPNNDSRIT